MISVAEARLRWPNNPEFSLEAIGENWTLVEAEAIFEQRRRAREFEKLISDFEGKGSCRPAAIARAARKDAKGHKAWLGTPIECPTGSKEDAEYFQTLLEVEEFRGVAFASALRTLARKFPALHKSWLALPCENLLAPHTAADFAALLDRLKREGIALPEAMRFLAKRYGPAHRLWVESQQNREN